ncbi:MAG: hypothetical protein ACI30O_07540 [Muribaculaceae bacterium]
MLHLPYLTAKKRHLSPLPSVRHKHMLYRLRLSSSHYAATSLYRKVSAVAVCR